MQGGGCAPNHEVNQDEEAPKDDTEAATDDRQQNILLENYTIPRRSGTRVINVSPIYFTA